MCSLLLLTRPEGKWRGKGLRPKGEETKHQQRHHHVDSPGNNPWDRAASPAAPGAALTQHRASSKGCVGALWVERSHLWDFPSHFSQWERCPGKEAEGKRLNPSPHLLVPAAQLAVPSLAEQEALQEQGVELQAQSCQSHDQAPHHPSTHPP